MSGNSTSLYSTSTSNITLSSNNFTTLYPGGSGTVTPAQPYGNANVVGLLAAGTDGANTVANIIATGNITGNYFVGNGSQLTGILGTYSNAQVSAYLASGTVTSNIITSANISGNYILGNGSQLTGLPVQYGNANVANFLASGNNSSNIITSANVTGAFLTTAGASGNISGVNYVNANLYLGNGSLLTGITAVSSNTAVTVTGNAQPNITSVGTLTSLSSTGNITGNYIIGNGSLLTAITGANVTGTVANATFATTAGSANTAVTVTGNAQANITSVGTLTSLSVSGNINGSNVNASTVQATTSAGLALKNSGGTTQASLGAGGGDNFTISVSTNINGANAQIDISPTGNSGHVHIKPTGTPSVEIAPTYTGSINNMIIGNITPVAVSATTVSASGNVTGNYFIGNGSQLTGIAASYGNAEVATFLAAFGSNTISTTGTVTAGNITGGNILTGGVVSATGNISGNVFLGNGSQLTGIVAASPGGSNTYIQFNNAGGFDGVSIMTYDSSTGNVQLSDLIIGTSAAGNVVAGGNATRINTSNAYVGTSLINNGFLAGQIVIGNGFFGNLNLNNIQARPGAKFNVWDSANVTEVGGNSLRYQALNTAGMISIGNIANTASLVRGGVGTLMIGGGPSANVWSATTQGMGAVVAYNQFLGVGQPNTVAALGNVILTGASAALGQAFVYAGSNVGNLGGVLAQVSAAGNVTSGIGMMPTFAGTPSTTPTNTFGFYMPGTTNNYGYTNSNGFRQATNYYFLRNDDNVAQNQLGSLRAYHTFQAGGNTTGTWDISKSNGQVQAVSLTGNVTIGSYTNFVTTANDGTNNDSQTDTVTLIIEQGATPYTVTMPTGNAAIRYASGNSTVPATANSTTTISIQAYRSAANATAYITTISPAAT
jgi:hypothetical protein